MYQNGINAIHTELSKTLCQKDVDFICNLITSSENDENLYRLDNSSYVELTTRGLWETLDDAVLAVTGHRLVHNNEAER